MNDYEKQVFRSAISKYGDTGTYYVREGKWVSDNGNS